MRKRKREKRIEHQAQARVEGRHTMPIQKLAEKIASKSGFALRQAKAALRAAATMEEDAGLRFEQNTFGGLFGSADKSEGMKAFLEKREAKWQHK